MEETKNYPVESRMVCLRDFFDKSSKYAVLKNHEARYVIPYYQRPYEWEWKDKQLKGLVNTFIKLSYEKTDDAAEENWFSYIDSEYVVFGTIQINRRKEGKEYEIIDGQQRIVSFWMFLKAIDVVCGTTGGNNLSFSVENQISTEYQNQFDKFWDSEEKNQYTCNYNEILCSLKKIPDAAKLSSLKKYILDKVLFSLMETSYNDDIDKTITLFDTLNTKGLDLGMKDIFKIKYFEFLKRSMVQINSEEETKKVFDKINRAYEYSKTKELKSAFQKNEDTLIDTYKLWILMKDKNYRKYSLPEKIKASSNKFFVDKKYLVWEKNLSGEEDVRSLSTFFAIAETILKTQSVLQKMNDCLGEDSGSVRKALLLCSDELLTNCGYWHLRNLFYVFTHAIRMKKGNNELSEEDVCKALSLCMKIWKICSVLKARDTRVKNDCFTNITDSIASVFVNDPEMDVNDLQVQTILTDDYKERFKDVVSGKKGYSVFENKQCWFLNVLTYIKECIDGSDLYEVRRRIFHTEKKEERCEIEHIASKAVCAGTVLEKYVNRIGNLVFLNNGINSTLGTRTKSIEKKEGLSLDEKLGQDFSTKINNKEKGYWKEKIENHNVAVSKFLESIPEEYVNGSQLMDVKTILKIIDDRNTELQDYIFEIYKDVL